MTIGVSQNFNAWASSVDGSSAVSGTSFTPTEPGRVVYIVLNHTQTASGIADATSITSNALTNVTKVVTQGYNTSTAAVKKIELWVATTTATAGTVTVNVSGTGTGFWGSLLECTGVVPSGTTYPGIVQVATAVSDVSSSPLVATFLQPFSNPTNATFAFWGETGSVSNTAKTGWTELGDSALSLPTFSSTLDWIAQPDVAPSVTPSGGTSYAGIVWEVQAVPARVQAIQETLLQPSTPRLLPTERFVRPAVTAVLGTITGTLATTNANDTSAAAGTTTVTGTLAKTNANDTSAAAGTTTVTGALAKTNANDTLAASGSVGSAVSGTLATTNANDTLAAAGTTKILGTSATTNANDTLTASGVVGTPVVTPPPPAQQVGGTLSGRRGPYTPVDAELEKILADDEEILVLL